MARFFRRGVSGAVFAPSVASLTAPTREELDAGVLLTGSIADIQGFMLENSPIATPALDTTFDEQINGPDQASDSALIFYDDDESETVRNGLAKGTDGFLVLLPYGDVEGKRAEVWPARSTGVNDEWDMGAVAARFKVGFAITSVPEQDSVVPAP
jgi:hypothetical protein